VLGNLASIFIEVEINLRLWIVDIEKSDSLFEVCSSRTGSWQRIVEILEFIVIRIVAEDPPSSGIYFTFQIFLVHQSLPGVSLHLIRFLGCRNRLWNACVEAIVLGVSFVWNFFKFRGRDTGIGFGGLYMSLLKRWLQLSMRWVSLAMACQWQQLTPMVDLHMLFKVSLPHKHPHAFMIWTFKCVKGTYLWSVYWWHSSRSAK